MENIIVVQSPFSLPEAQKTQYAHFDAGGLWTGTPKESEYIKVPFRLLSAHIVGAGTWKATEFGEVVLRASMDLLVGKPVYLDHDTWAVKNAIGVIESVEWQEANSEIPAGINGVLKIDAHSHPQVARAIITNPPIISACSVGIEYTYLPSHAFEHDWEFRDKVGEMIEGTMVRRIVQEIKDYKEVSLVSFPADPFAKKLDKDGNPYKPNMNKVARFSEEPEEIQEKFTQKNIIMVQDNNQEEVLETVEFSESENTPQSQAQPEPTEESPNPTPTNEEANHSEEVATLRIALQGSQEEVEQMKKAIADHKTLHEIIQATSKKLEVQIEQLQGELTVAKAEYERAKPFVSLAKEVIEAKRAEVLRCYNLSTKEPSEKVHHLIAEAGIEQLGAYMDMYGVKLLEQFSPQCKVCGGKNVSFRSSVPEGEQSNAQPTAKRSFRKLFRS